jgi:hypothetical protein
MITQYMQLEKKTRLDFTNIVIRVVSIWKLYFQLMGSSKITFYPITCLISHLSIFFHV